MKYLVIEVQTNASGEVGNFVFTFDDRNEADAKYHTLLASACVSDVPIHCIYMITNDGQFINCEPHRHGEEPEEN